MRKFSWKGWLETWLEIAWLPLMVVYLIVAPFRSILITLDEIEQLRLALWFILQGILLGGALSLWDAIYAMRRERQLEH